MPPPVPPLHPPVDDHEKGTPEVGLLGVHQVLVDPISSIFIELAASNVSVDMVVVDKRISPFWFMASA